MEAKHLDLFGRKVFTSASLQFSIANYQTLMSKYDFISYTKFSEFAEKLRQEVGVQFPVLIKEGKMITRSASIDVAVKEFCSGDGYSHVEIFMSLILWVPQGSPSSPQSKICSMRETICSVKDK